MRVWRVDAIRAYLSSIRTDWVLDREFSKPGLDVWICKLPDGRYASAKLQYWPATADRPAVTPETGVVAFCRQLDVELRLFLDALGREGQYFGPL